ncbi:hypothetical protein BXZ70DRAFT_197814 [Cristinia sonorae]|uniref:Uncharacterized protein n=1 Tax=Cristinia sonorae TaxID=1940300 RepID=A0A8K0UPK2_9AGAR|nr:hypothetical protein BXZ70DRAFT_197814 [Cristinia sonorae]
MPPSPPSRRLLTIDPYAPQIAIATTNESQCQKEGGSRRMGCLKQQPHGKPWKKVLHFILHPSIVPIPNLLPLLPPFPAPSPHALPVVISAAGVRGKITRFVTTIPSASSTYHFYELDVADLDPDWLESKERRREWVDYAEAARRIAWKAELAQALSLSSIAPKR